VLWSSWLELPPDQRHELHRLADYAGLPGEGRYEPYGDKLREQLLDALYRCNSWIAIVTITDLLGGEERFNVPGTSAASNWSQRLANTVEQLAQDPECLAKARSARESLARAGRALPTPE
jgi:4-alpha-glucanotransferase